MPFSVSDPLHEMAGLAAVSADRINAIIEKRLARGEEGLLRPGHHYPSTLKRRTGIPVATIRRLNRHLLMTIEGSGPVWSYREYNRNSCALSLLLDLPATLSAAAICEKVGRVVSTGTPLDDVKISGVDAEDGGWTVLTLAPVWRRF